MDLTIVLPVVWIARNLTDFNLPLPVQIDLISSGKFKLQNGIVILASAKIHIY